MHCVHIVFDISLKCKIHIPTTSIACACHIHVVLMHYSQEGLLWSTKMLMAFQEGKKKNIWKKKHQSIIPN